MIQKRRRLGEEQEEQEKALWCREHYRVAAGGWIFVKAELLLWLLPGTRGGQGQGRAARGRRLGQQIQGGEKESGATKALGATEFHILAHCKHMTK